MRSLVLMVLAVAPHRLDSRREPGAESCPDEQQVRRAVTERLGSSPFGPDAKRTVTVRWRNQGGAYASELTVTDDQGAPVGSKKLTSSARDCSELAASTALALALILDPLSLSRPAAAPAPSDAPQLQPPPPPPTTAADAPQLQPPPPPPTTRPTEAPSPSLPPPPPVSTEPVASSGPAPAKQEPQGPPPETLRGFWLGGAGGISAFEQPLVSGLLELSLAGATDYVMVGGKLGWSTPVALQSSQGSLNTTLVTLGPFVCAGSMRVGGCASLRLGFAPVWTSGFSSLPGTTVGLTWLAVAIGPYLDFNPLHALKVRVFANLQLQPISQVLLLGGYEVWRTPLFGFNLGVALFGRP
ncbi:MAG: hypothetical protein IPJ65_00130 [Archangiaceae bacterium]|nr:hypothetical protein [Archangiaceae bacterium]